MPKRLPMFYSAILLTLVNLLLRFVGTSFQVHVSASLGAAGVGLLQLVLSVGSLAMVAGMAGIRTATMYLTAEELGRKQKRNITWVLSGCLLYSIAFSVVVGGLLYVIAPWAAQRWIGDIRTLPALRLLAAFLPVTCLYGVMTGYFTAANRIGTLAAVEVGEQLCAMAVTMMSLRFWAGEDPGRACMCVVLGSGVSACLALVVLVVLRLQERMGAGKPLPIRKRLWQAALPLAAADVLKSGITTTENLMVPKRLALNSQTQDPLAAFGLLSGMVFPILMFPACILFGLAELLIPELARCAAAHSRQRITYLVKRGLKVAMLYGMLFAGLQYLLAEPLCMLLYKNQEAAVLLKWYAVLIPMLYCDAITDAMTKGLGQQRSCVRYNILTSAMDVALLYLLLPRYGMEGYFFSFLVTHAINFCLSLRQLMKITGGKIPFWIPTMAAAGSITAVWIADMAGVTALAAAAYPLAWGSLMYLMGVVGREDLSWMRGLLRGKRNVEKWKNSA